jgi:hypothetical protein
LSIARPIFLKEKNKMSKLQTTMMLFAGLGALALSPAVRAQGSNVSWSQRTVFTFSGPVEIPGQVLPAGTYVFKLADISSNRNVVQVFNKDENHLFGMFLAVPDYRLYISDKNIIKFAERPAGSPPAIKAWFNPRRSEGHEFVYPKDRAIALAKANNTPVPAMPVALTPETIKPTATMKGPEFTALYMAYLKAEEPTGEEVELAEAFGAPDSQASAPLPELPDKLPSTASPLTLMGLVGLTTLGAAVTLRLATARKK